MDGRIAHLLYEDLEGEFWVKSDTVLPPLPAEAAPGAVARSVAAITPAAAVAAAAATATAASCPAAAAPFTALFEALAFNRSAAQDPDLDLPFLRRPAALATAT